MRRAVAPALAGAVMLVMSAAADAEPKGGDAVSPPHRRMPPNVFISPSGEPFRGAADAPYAAASWFHGADTDGDGRLTRAEFVGDAERFFHRLDSNGDGVVDGFEIRAYEDTVAPEILPRIGSLRSGEGQDRALFHDRNDGVDVGERRGGRAGSDVLDDAGRGRIRASDTTFSGAGVFSVLNEPEPVQACDTDLDGKVTFVEWRAKADRRFTLLDPRSRGYLTLDTLPKTYVQEAIEKEAARRAKAIAAGRPY